ncbi:MAG: transcriptional regulator [Methylocystaceae bacterium]|nr:MAG: transcriptional regulator [Methylocystaceae bacterium]
MAKAFGSARHKALIEFLVQRRKRARMTQAQLAARLGEYQSFVARLESGERRVDVVEFLELSEILDFDPVQAIRDLRKMS